jgi:hypothetical protein
MGRLVHEVGINDAGYVVKIQKELPKVNGKRTRKQVWECPYYRKWKNMLHRCYSDKYHERNPTYRGCAVCEEWLTFSNFKSWMEKQDWEDKDLDKDLIEANNKTYSPEKCIFISHQVNAFMSDSGGKRGKHLIEVDFHKGSKKLRARCENPFTKKKDHLGYFSDELEAHKAWQKRKLELAIQLGDLPENKYIKNYLVRHYTFEEDDTINY